MIVHRNGQHAFCAVLSDDVLVEFCLYFLWRVKAKPRIIDALAFVENILAGFDAFVANGHAVGTVDDGLNFAFALSAETAM